MADKYFIRASESAASIDDLTIENLTDYLSLIGVSDTDIDVTTLISSNCISEQIQENFFDTSTGTDFTGAINIQKEDYEGKITFNSYMAGSSSIDALLAGTSPHFNNEFCEITYPGDYTIVRDSDGSKLTIGGRTMYPSDFVDGVVPLRAIAVLQGAGGGGGGSNLVANGSGGGSGGLSVFIIDLTSNWTVHVGTGGAGGNNTNYYGSDNSGSNEGECGEATTLTLTDVGGIKLEAGGGGGGNIASEGGSGGTSASSVGKGMELGSIDGATGGKGAGLMGVDSAYGNRPEDFTVSCTSRTLNSESKKSVTYVGHNGGGGDGNDGGGGAGSYFGDGGEGCFENGDTQKNGSYGSGGGGATFGEIDGKGGNGGDGLFRLYY